MGTDNESARRTLSSWSIAMASVSLLLLGLVVSDIDTNTQLWATVGAFIVIVAGLIVTTREHRRIQREMEEVIESMPPEHRKMFRMFMAAQAEKRRWWRRKKRGTEGGTVGEPGTMTDEDRRAYFARFAEELEKTKSEDSPSKH